MLEPENISFLLWYYLENSLIEWIGPKGYGIFCADNEIVFCGTFALKSLVIETFIGKRSTNPALFWNPAATITWHKKQRQMKMGAFARAM